MIISDYLDDPPATSSSNGVAVNTGTSGSTEVTLKSIEVRVGNERITKFGEHLSDINTFCGMLSSETSATGNFTILCSKALTGRYLTVQLLTYGYLHFDEVEAKPTPGMVEFQ